MLTDSFINTFIPEELCKGETFTVLEEDTGVDTIRSWELGTVTVVGGELF